MNQLVKQVTEQLVDDFKFSVAVIDGKDKDTLTTYQQKMRIKKEEAQLKEERFAVFGAKVYQSLIHIEVSGLKNFYKICD